MRRILAVLVVLVVPALVSAQSLGDAARKEKERRKKNQESGVKVRTITDEQVDTDTSDDPPVSSDPAPATPAASSAGSSASSTKKTQNEQDWRFRMSQARARKEKADQRYTFLNGLSLVNGEYYVDENGKAVITSLSQLRKMIAEAKRDADAADKAVRDIEDQARRQGVPPGWLR